MQQGNPIAKRYLATQYQLRKALHIGEGKMSVLVNEIEGSLSACVETEEPSKRKIVKFLPPELATFKHISQVLNSTNQMLLTTDLIKNGYTIQYVAKNLENMIGLSHDNFYTMLKDKESDKLSLVSAPLDSMEGAGLPSTLHIWLFDNNNAFKPYDS